MKPSEVSAFLLTHTELGKKIPSELLATAEMSDLVQLEGIDGVAAQVLFGRGVDGAVIAARHCTDPVWLAKRIRGESRVSVLNALAVNPHVPQESLDKLMTKLLKQRLYLADSFGSVWKRLPTESVLESYQAAKSNTPGYYADRMNLDRAFGIAIGRSADEATLRRVLSANCADYTAYGIAVSLLSGDRKDLTAETIVEVLALRGDLLNAAYQAVVDAKHLTEVHARVYDSWNLSGRSPVDAFSRRVVYVEHRPGMVLYTADPQAARLLANSENVLSRALSAHIADVPDDVFDRIIDDASTYCLVLQLLVTKDEDRVKRIIAAMPPEYKFDAETVSNLLSRFDIPRPLVYRLLDNPHFTAGLLVDCAKPATSESRMHRPSSRKAEPKFVTQPGDVRVLSTRDPEWVAAMVGGIVRLNWEDVPHEIAVEVLEVLPGVAKYVFSVSSPLRMHVARYLNETFGEDSGSAALFISLAPNWSATFPALLDSVRSLR